MPQVSGITLPKTFVWVDYDPNVKIAGNLVEISAKWLAWQAYRGTIQGLCRPETSIRQGFGLFGQRAKQLEEFQTLCVDTGQLTANRTALSG